MKRILVVAPKGWWPMAAEMRLHFGEKFQFIEPSELAAFRSGAAAARGGRNLWRMPAQ
ncbi:hypothetical protein [Parasulfuritortus cantonensis]|uniref:hypothetical protein n=1 Tax=Parasulfuritortus cantonensis TaxID=2528202 RepID=UPI0019824719|nr:hypothetical protein [Parasulfuritortus cantonensis]